MKTFKQFLTEAMLSEQYDDDQIAEYYGQDPDEIRQAYKKLSRALPMLYGKLDLIDDAEVIQQLSMAFCGGVDFDDLPQNIQKILLKPETIEAVFGGSVDHPDSRDEGYLDFIYDDLGWPKDRPFTIKLYDKFEHLNIAEYAQYLHNEY